jgi:phage-related protein
MTYGSFLKTFNSRSDLPCTVPISAKKHPDAKPLKGFKGSGVLEVVEDFDGDTYRAVYTVKFEGVVYVLHAFQKKSKRGIATPKQDIELIETRLKRAKEDYESYLKQNKQEE